MRIVTLTLLASAVAWAQPGLAKENADQTAENRVSVATTDSGAAKKICRRPMETGTRLTPRLCLTKEEWKQIEEEKYGR